MRIVFAGIGCAKALLLGQVLRFGTLKRLMRYYGYQGFCVPWICSVALQWMRFIQAVCGWSLQRRIILQPKLAKKKIVRGYWLSQKLSSGRHTNGAGWYKNRRNNVFSLVQYSMK